MIGNRSQSVIVLFLVDSLPVEFPEIMFFLPLASFLTDGRVTVSWLEIGRLFPDNFESDYN